MFVTRFLAPAAALALMSGVAMAQSTAPASDPAAMPMSDPAAPAAPAPSDQIAPPADPAATGTATDTAGRVMTSSMPPEQQAGLKAGDPNVVSNPPVADTPENRKLYGKPMSNAGKRTAPKGN